MSPSPIVVYVMLACFQIFALMASSTTITPQATVPLGAASGFAILSSTGVTDVYQSSVTGNVGSSPITGAAILISCGEVVGTIMSVDAAGPAPCSVKDPSFLAQAILDMGAAYANAYSRINPNYLNLGAGEIGGLTITPGLYQWTSPVSISTSVTFSGSSTDIFVLQIDNTLTMASNMQVTLAGGALPSNIFWAVAGTVTINTGSQFNGIILAKTDVNLRTGASLHGQVLAQTAVTLQMNTVVLPTVHQLR